jgi:hypothetical protein
MNINNINYRESVSIDWLSHRSRARLKVVLQALIFSQSLVFAIVAWLLTGLTEYAIYGFMVGSLGTIIATFFQCNKGQCRVLNKQIKARIRGISNNLFGLIKIITPVLILISYSSSLVG